MRIYNETPIPKQRREKGEEKMRKGMREERGKAGRRGSDGRYDKGQEK